MPGAWFREDGEYVWKEPDPPRPEVDLTDNPVVDMLFGPKGEVLAMWREREPIGFKSSRWPKTSSKDGS